MTNASTNIVVSVRLDLLFFARQAALPELQQKMAADALEAAVARAPRAAICHAMAIPMRLHANNG